jgi:hypothetical protein
MTTESRMYISNIYEVLSAVAYIEAYSLLSCRIYSLPLIYIMFCFVLKNYKSQFHLFSLVILFFTIILI